ncbi:hypothetical protein CKAH01_00751 [Colletotrichum kahawae]|uniref:Uncharacterized protein n=1 Tax=Colletotrichum kahawae TaxID=34407 RepID=A0AAD9YL21_COLKA|nr:hypothetical protein CKAH01_00751 [Colletotrichum kahawae]
MSIAIRNPDQCPSGPSAVNRAGRCPPVLSKVRDTQDIPSIATSIFFTAPNLRNLVAWPGFTAKKRGQPAPTASLRLARGDHGPRDVKVVDILYQRMWRVLVHALRCGMLQHNLISSLHLIYYCCTHGDNRQTLDMR